MTKYTLDEAEGLSSIPNKLLTEEGRKLRNLLKEKIGYKPSSIWLNKKEIVFRWVMGYQEADILILMDFLEDQDYPRPKFVKSISKERNYGSMMLASI